MPTPANQPKFVSQLSVTMSRIMKTVDGYSGRLQAFMQEFLFRAGNPVETLYNVAIERQMMGDFEDAATRLRLVLKFRPELADAWYRLGACQISLDQDAEAATSFRRALALMPQHEEAKYLLAVVQPESIAPGQEPKFAPLSLAANHFDMLAEDYDTEQLNELGYRGHEALAHSVKTFLDPEYKSYRIVDLGCGTGLVGLQMRDVAGLLEGVDISRMMLMQAELRRDSNEKHVYDKLHLIDLRRYLIDQTPDSLDMVLAANVFPFVGGLTPVFDGAFNALKPGGLFAFSVEMMKGEEFHLIPGEGRFAHSDHYILAHAKRVGLEVLEAKTITLFTDYEAMQYVLRKPGSSQ